ncbi:MAG: hypothetical protein MK034_00780 [Dehalococcoidia bacterium]|jgi:hypothetical protein|nr:hypothetical protein [Dehalococcoidia bacterium]|tara:strand:+ start:544 stop:732 length:189 start_codon:yes stop_codon:yes gene_type:complete
MFYRTGINSFRASMGCGFFIVIIGAMLLSPLVDLIVDLLGWILILTGALILGMNTLQALFKK